MGRLDSQHIGITTMVAILLWRLVRENWRPVTIINIIAFSYYAAVLIWMWNVGAFDR